MNEELQTLLKSGIEAARGGNKVVARRIFEQVLRDDPQNELAWMWLATVLDAPAERRKALQRVLSINPDNERAKQALAKLQAVTDIPADKVAPELTSSAVETPEIKPVRPTIEELRARARAETRGPSWFYILLLALAAGFIIAAAILIALQLTEEETEATPTAVAGPPTVAATLPPPTQPIQTAAPGSIERAELGPTWTPSPTNTQPASATPTATLLPLTEYEIIFVSADSPVGLRRLQMARADGSEVRPINVEMDPAQIEINFTPAPQVVVTESSVISTEEASEVVATETVTEGTSEPTLYGEIEFLDPAVSPDGNFLAFTAQISPEVQEIFVMPLPDGAARQLTDLGGSETGGAAWSPEGNQIAFHSNADSDFDVYMVDVDGGDPTNMTPSEQFDERDPVFDPQDSRRLIIASDQATPGETEIWLLPFGSGQPRQLTDDIGSSFAPTVSPDGNLIAFISNRSGDNDLYVMNIDGTNERVVSLNDRNADDFSPAWSPDGIWILVSSEREDEDVLQLWTARPDGSEWIRVTDSEGPSQDGVWIP